jgi:hypothetical protein
MQFQDVASASGPKLAPPSEVEPTRSWHPLLPCASKSAYPCCALKKAIAPRRFEGGAVPPVVEGVGVVGAELLGCVVVEGVEQPAHTSTTPAMEVSRKAPGRDRKLLRTDRASHRMGRMSMNRVGQSGWGHCANRVKPRIVTTKTPEPRIRRNGFTPRSTSSAAQMIRVTSAIARITDLNVPCGWRKCKAIDESMKTDNEILGHWATVMRPVRRLRTIQRKDREINPGTFVGRSICRRHLPTMPDAERKDTAAIQ